jgi:hypothetical protein
VQLGAISLMVTVLAVFGLPVIYCHPQLLRCSLPLREVVLRKTFMLLAVGEIFQSAAFYPLSYVLSYWMLLGAT